MNSNLNKTSCIYKNNTQISKSVNNENITVQAKPSYNASLFRSKPIQTMKQSTNNTVYNNKNVNHLTSVNKNRNDTSQRMISTMHNKMTVKNLNNPAQPVSLNKHVVFIDHNDINVKINLRNIYLQPIVDSLHEPENMAAQPSSTKVIFKSNNTNDGVTDKQNVNMHVLTNQRSANARNKGTKSKKTNDNKRPIQNRTLKSKRAKCVETTCCCIKGVWKCVVAILHCATMCIDGPKG